MASLERDVLLSTLTYPGCISYLGLNRLEGHGSGAHAHSHTVHETATAMLQRNVLKKVGVAPEDIWQDPPGQALDG